MPRTPTVASEVVREYLRKFPAASTNGLADKLYREQKSLWNTLNACRLMVRRLRGAQGEANRKRTKPEKSERVYDAEKQFKLPKGRTEYDDWKPHVIDTAGRWLVMSDIHVPWHDDEAIRACIKEARSRTIKGIILNGDTSDGYALSRWEKDPRKRRYAEEVKTHNELLAHLRQQFPKARLVYKYGNHDERFDAYLQVKAADLLDIPQFQYEEVMGLNEHGFECVKDKRVMLLGKLAVLHGHEYANTPFGPVNPARGLFMKAIESAMCGHLHRSSQHSEPTLTGHLISTWSTGCLCQMHPEYAAINKWNQGAAFVEIDNHGAYDVDNLRWYKGKLRR